MPHIPQTNRPLVLASVIAAMFMVAIEATIVSTVMPQIAGQLGGLNLYSWVFSSFLLTQTATTVVFGKLSDLYGRKPVLLFGIAIFLIGSVLAGFAWSMPSMIVFRLIQGIGAGSIQPVGMTVVGDLYSARERGKIQGFLASVWGISAVLGPLAGGLIIQKLSWAWVFWINVPLGLLAAAGFVLFLHEGVVHRRRSIDFAGATLFTVSIASLMIALTEFGTSDTSSAVFATVLALVSGALFLWQERRAKDPMVELGLWGRRPIAATNGASLLAGMAVIGLTTFLPMYVQGVLQQSALIAGFALTMLVLGWPIGATLAANALVRFGLRPVLLVGSLLLPVGGAVFLFLNAEFVSRLGRHRLAGDGFRHGAAQHGIPGADPGDRRLGAARQRHGLESVFAQSRQHARRHIVRRGAELWAGAFPRRRRDVRISCGGCSTPCPGQERRPRPFRRARPA